MAEVPLSRRQAGVALLGKRIFDRLLAAALLLAVAPVLLVTAAAVYVSSGRPVLFRQVRVGRGGRPFTMLKFRSMVVDADPEVHRRFVETLLHEGSRRQMSGDGEPPVFKLVEDPRVTPVGRIIRAYSIDELPQLFNVLKGEMSLVGPRPEVPYVLASYESWQWRRFAVLPGMTGLWQVEGRAQLSPADMLRLDVEYAERWSFWLDCVLLVKTLPRVLNKVGSG